MNSEKNDITDDLMVTSKKYHSSGLFVTTLGLIFFIYAHTNTKESDYVRLANIYN